MRSRQTYALGHLILKQTMSEDEVIEDEMIDLGDEVDFDDDMILDEDDLLVDGVADLESNPHEIE